MAAREFDFLGNSTYFQVGRGLYTHLSNVHLKLSSQPWKFVKCVQI